MLFIMSQGARHCILSPHLAKNPGCARVSGRCHDMQPHKPLDRL